ncbi:hypothetical protein E4K72_07765 [Oxalobacteraceae bacterium OM1]|nr:hypothetical protein E4K72_07765 [Oxalobacteraceae bacterium OM1]
MRAIIAVALGGAFVLSACTTPEQRAAYQESNAQRLVVEYGPACDKLGYQQGSDAWRNCILQLSTKDDLRYANTSYGPPYWGPRWRRW